MSFAWAAYLTLAEALFRERVTFADQEACCRAAISRAYYAVFCAARNHARDNEGLPLPRGGRVHQAVIDHYSNHTSQQYRAIGWALRRLRHLRNRADYDDANIRRRDAGTQNALDQAPRVFTPLDQLSP